MANDRTLAQSETLDSVDHEVIGLAKSDDGKVECREVMMQEKLSLHEEEGEVVESPAQNRSTNLIIKTLEGDVAVVVAASLPSKNGETLEGDVKSNGGSRGPPDERVANQVDLSVVLAPEVDTATEDGP